MLSKKQIINYLENELHFRDYRFKNAKYFGKVNIPSSIHILNPLVVENLDSAVDMFVKEGFNTIIIYLGKKG